MISKFSLGPWAFESGANTPSIKNYDSGYILYKEFKNGIDAPSWNILISFLKYSIDASFNNFLNFSLNDFTANPVLAYNIDILLYSEFNKFYN